MREYGDRQSLGPGDYLVIEDSPNGAASPIPLHHVHHELLDVRNDDERDLDSKPSPRPSQARPLPSRGQSKLLQERSKVIVHALRSNLSFRRHLNQRKTGDVHRLPRCGELEQLQGPSVRPA